MISEPAWTLSHHSMLPSYDRPSNMRKNIHKFIVLYIYSAGVKKKGNAVHVCLVSSHNFLLIKSCCTVNGCKKMLIQRKRRVSEKYWDVDASNWQIFLVFAGGEKIKDRDGDRNQRSIPSQGYYLGRRKGWRDRINYLNLTENSTGP